MDQKSWVQNNSDLLVIGVTAGRESWDVRAKGYGSGCGSGSAAGARYGCECGAAALPRGLCSAWGAMGAWYGGVGR